MRRALSGSASFCIAHAAAAGRGPSSGTLARLFAPLRKGRAPSSCPLFRWVKNGGKRRRMRLSSGPGSIPLGNGF